MKTHVSIILALWTMVLVTTKDNSNKECDLAVIKFIKAPDWVKKRDFSDSELETITKFLHDFMKSPVVSNTLEKFISMMQYYNNKGERKDTDDVDTVTDELPQYLYEVFNDTELRDFSNVFLERKQHPVMQSLLSWARKN